MKHKNSIIIGILTSAVLILAVSFFLGGQGRSSQVAPFRVENSGAFLPQMDGPNMDRVSLAEAMTRVPFTISSPEGFEVLEMWVSNNTVEPKNQTVVIDFKGNIRRLVLRVTEKQPDWEEEIASSPEFTKITVNGHTGLGISPGETKYNDNAYPHPGSVSWWVDGLGIVLFSDTLPMEALLKIAETMPY